MDNNVGEIAKKINIKGDVKFDEVMSRHTAFEIGGPADIYAVPLDEADVIHIAGLAYREKVPLFILGAGANILVSDKGIRGIVLDMSSFTDIQIEENRLHCGSGAHISRVSEAAARHSLRGLEFIYKMPGSVGGAVWMNARCYDRSISELPGTIHYLNESLEHESLELPDSRFSYKKSPFQARNVILLYADFSLEQGDQERIRQRMHEIEEDRRNKGHFEHPSAGSVFKNNRSFGGPSGKIIDDLGLRGFRWGGAQIAPFHGNIIINTGGARAEDVRSLILHAQDLAYAKHGIALEPEIRLVGEWSEL